MDLHEMELYYLDQLRQLQESYRKDAKPIIDRLVEIRNIRRPTYVLTAEQIAGLAHLV